MESDKETKLYWAVGRGRELPGDIKRPDMSEIVNNATLAYGRALLRPDTKFTLAWMKKTSFMVKSTYLGLINDAQVVSDIIDAEDAGYDVAMLGPNWEPGLRAAREAVCIPVVGAVESSTCYARSLGTKFAYLTPIGYGHFITHNLQMNGLTGHAVAHRPVREFLPSEIIYESVVDCIEGKSDQFLTLLEKSAKEAIADGADVIIVGGQFLGLALLKAKFVAIPNTGVPVIDAIACGLKSAEMFADLRRSTGIEKSQHPLSPYRTPPRDLVDKARRTFGLIPDGES